MSVTGGADKLISIIIPDTVTEIGERAFDDCKNLKQVLISDGARVIGGGAFRYKDPKAEIDNDSLVSVTLPDSVVGIGEYDLYQKNTISCKWICWILLYLATSIVIPKSVEYIGNLKLGAYGEDFYEDFG